MNDIVFEVLKAAVYVIVAVAARYIIPAARNYITQSKYSFLGDLIVDAVFAYEQEIQGEKMGSKRKDFVSEYALRMANKYGINITPEQINIMIEAAVKAMNSASQSPDVAV